MTPEQQRQLFGKKTAATARHTGVGLRNVLERLELLYGTDASLQVESSEGNTCITVVLPLNYEIPLDFDDQGLV